MASPSLGLWNCRGVLAFVVFFAGSAKESVKSSRWNHGLVLDLSIWGPTSCDDDSFLGYCQKLWMTGTAIGKRFFRSPERHEGPPEFFCALSSTDPQANRLIASLMTGIWKLNSPGYVQPQLWGGGGRNERSTPTYFWAVWGCFRHIPKPYPSRSSSTPHVL